MADRAERRRLKRDMPLGDADWFAAHPHRQFRLRPLFPGEAFFVDDDFKAPDGWVVWHIIQRLAPGLRSKHTVCVDPEIAADANSCDALVKALFELLVTHPTGERVNVHEVAELAKQYARAETLN